MASMLSRRTVAAVSLFRWKETLILVATLFAGFLPIMDQSFFGDEGFHIVPIHHFLEGRFDMGPSVTQLPGYHLMIAGIARFVGVESLIALRVISFAFSLASIAVFASLVAFLRHRRVDARTLQYVFIPILFPYFYFLYTDVLSTMLVLLGTALVLRRKYELGALVGLLSVGVRQNNIVWLLFLFALFVVQEWPAMLRMVPAAARAIRARWKLRLPQSISWRRFLLAALVFAVGFGAFAAFVRWNGGVALGDKESHPFPSFHTGNIFFCLFLAFFMFLPLHVANFPRIVRALRESNYLLPFILNVLFIYLLTFQNDHWYNQGIDSVYIRNRILVYFTADWTMKLLFFIPVAYATLSLAVTKFVRPSFYMLYPMTVLYLLPSWLIEQRYYFIPFALFLAFRESRSTRLEYLMAAYGFVCSIVLYAALAMRWFFL